MPSLVALAAAVLFWPSQGDTPKFEGKSLDRWFNGWVRTHQPITPPPPVFKHLGEEAVPYLIQKLQTQDDGWRGTRIRIFGAFPPILRTRIPGPVTGVDIRWKAAWALESIGSEAQSAVEPLTRALTDAHVLVRLHAATTLSKIGPAASSAVPDLIRLFESPAHDTRHAAALALKRIGGYPSDLEHRVNTYSKSESIRIY